MGNIDRPCNILNKLIIDLKKNKKKENCVHQLELEKLRLCNNHVHCSCDMFVPPLYSIGVLDGIVLNEIWKKHAQVTFLL